MFGVTTKINALDRGWMYPSALGMCVTAHNGGALTR